MRLGHACTPLSLVASPSMPPPCSSCSRWCSTSRCASPRSHRFPMSSKTCFSECWLRSVPSLVPCQRSSQHLTSPHLPLALHSTSPHHLQPMNTTAHKRLLSCVLSQLPSAYRPYVIVNNVTSTEHLEMLRIDCSGKTRLALHVPSSDELESVNIVIII